MGQKFKSGDSTKSSITPYQSFIFVYLTMTGVGFLITIRNVAESTGTDGIWVFLISGIILYGLILIMTKLCQRFPKQTLVQFTPTILDIHRNQKLGRALSLIFIVPLLLIWVFVIASQVRVFAEVLVSSSYPQTPTEVFIFTLLAVSSIAASSKPGVIARFNEIIFPLTLVPIVIFFIGIFEKGNWIHFFPMFQMDWVSILKGILVITYSFIGFEVILFYSGYYQQPQKAVLAHSVAMASVTVLYMFIYITTLAIFGVEEIKKMMWPVLEVIKVIDFPIGLLERWESGMLAIWMVMVISSVSNIFVALAGSINNLFQIPDGHSKKLVWGFLVIIYLLATYPNDIQQVFQYMDLLSKLYFTIIPISILLLLVIAWIRKKRGDQNVSS